MSGREWVLRQSHGLTVDHVALGVRDMPAALAWLEDRTGARPYSTDPEPGQWYWSGALALGADCFLELIGPNPAHRGFHPVKQIVRGYDAPSLMFWYVSTNDFDGLAREARRLGADVERVEEVRYVRDGHPVHYKRGVLGPGFVSQRPCIIEWRQRYPRPDADRSCRLLGLELHHPEADAMRRVLEPLGIDPLVQRGAPRIALHIDTPRGPLELSAHGEHFAGPSAAVRMAVLYLRHALGALARR